MSIFENVRAQAADWFKRPDADDIFFHVVTREESLPVRSYCPAERHLTLLSVVLDETRDAAVRGSRYPMRLDANWSPEPDILIVRASRRHLMTPQRLEGPADMVVEIASESDPGLDYREKLPRYREAGIEEIWIVDPFEQRVLAETKTTGGYTATTLSSGRLESRVVSGFWIDVSWLWQQELPSTVQCLRDMRGRSAV